MDLYSNIDYKKLREQKAILINMIQDWGEADDPDQQKDAQQAEGLVHLIDAIQDNAVENLNMSEGEVFGFKTKVHITGAMVKNARQFLVDDSHSIRTQLHAIVKQSEIDEESLIDYVDKVQVWHLVEFRFSCKEFLECIK